MDFKFFSIEKKEATKVPLSGKGEGGRGTKMTQIIMNRGDALIRKPFSYMQKADRAWQN